MMGGEKLLITLTQGILGYRITCVTKYPMCNC